MTTQSQSHTQRALHAEIARLTPRPTQQDMEAMLGLAQSAISQYLSGRHMPDSRGIRVLATRWVDPIGGLRILMAYLLDIVERAGRPDEVEITARDHPSTVPASIASDIALLRQEANAVPDTAALVHGICEIIRHAHSVVGIAPLAAEAGPEWRGRKRQYIRVEKPEKKH